MAIVVVGGHTRNIGKTSVVAGLIAAMPEMQWTAIKITQFGHGVCSANGEACDCVTADHTLAVSEELHRESGTDSSRYLAAGAFRSYWVRTRQGQLSEAMPKVKKMLQGNVIIESNSVLRFLQPDVSLSVLDPSVIDFKESAMRYLDRVDAVVIPEGNMQGAAWSGVSLRLIESKPRFIMRPSEFCSAELVKFVRKTITKKAAKSRELVESSRLL
jgi:hypothetical protein